jgi:hypothetical protein
VIAAYSAKVEPSLSDTRIGMTMEFQISSPYSRGEVNITIYNYSTSHRHIVKHLFAYVKPPSFLGFPVQILTRTAGSTKLLHARISDTISMIRGLRVNF